MSDEPSRPTVPDRPSATVELPLSPARARQLADALHDYARVSVAVKRALETASQDDGKAYRDARDMKNAHFNVALGVFESVLAYIGVHAQ